MMTFTPLICEKNGKHDADRQGQPHAAMEQLPDRSALLGDGLLDFGQLPPGGLAAR